MFETERHGVSYAVSPVDDGCTTDVLLQPADREVLLFTLNGISARLLERGYRGTGQETESVAEGLDGTALPVTDIAYLSRPANARC